MPSAQEKIQKKAYELYLKRGGAHGDDLGDWLQAEKAVKAPAKKAAPKKAAPKKAVAKKAPVKKAPAKKPAAKKAPAKKKK